MPNVNGSESTSPPDGGNVVEPYKTTPLTHSNDVKKTPWAKSPINQTEFAFLHDGSHLNTQQDLDPDGGQLDPSTQTQADTYVKDVPDRERVIREVGLTSTSFIGPACRPEPCFEQELSEFYKELEKVDTVDGGDADTKPVEQQDLHPPCKPESNLPNRTDSPATVTDHGRAYRPYPDPHKRNQKDPNRWRAHHPEGRRAHPEPCCPPPPWAPPHPRAQFLPLMYPPDTRPQENFVRLQANNNNSWGPWRGPPFPSNRWPEHRAFPSHEHHRLSEEYQTPLAHWQQRVSENDSFQNYNNNCLVLILLRGVPGSGKSTLARELLSTGPNGVVLSTDDYFFQDNRYAFDSSLLGDAHDWNQKRAEQAMLEGRSPVIIDNTNVKAWEMKPYVEMALESGYRVDFLEPETRWKYDPAQLEKRNKHCVPRETIAKMLDGFERPVNVDIVMNSVVPPHKSKGH